MESRICVLEKEVQCLREEVRELRLTLQRAQREFEAATRRRTDSEYKRGTSYSSVLDSPLRPSSAGSFSLVGGERQTSRGSSAGDSRAGVAGSEVRGVHHVGGSASRSPGAGSGGSRPTLSWGEREEICDEIAEWVLRCLRVNIEVPAAETAFPLAAGFGSW